MKKCLLRLRNDMLKDKKLEIMAEIEKQAEAVQKEKKKKHTAALGKNLMFEFRVSKMVAAFRIRHQKRKTFMEEKKTQALNENILKGPTDIEDTVEAHMSTRGILAFKMRGYESEVVLKRVISKGEGNSLDKFYFCFYDDILAWKEKSNSHKVQGKVFLTSIISIGAEKEKYFYCVTQKNIFFFMCDNQKDRNKWMRSVTFLRDHALKEIKPLVFEKYYIVYIRFECISEAEKYDELFIADEQVYDFKKVKIVKTKKEKKEFNMDQLALADEKPKDPVKPSQPQPISESQLKSKDNVHQDPQKGALSDGKILTKERSVEMLSMSDDDEPPVKQPRKAEVPYVDTRNEKPTDVFKNMYSDFKDFIPGKKTNDGQPNAPKPSFMNKARGFFGL